MAHATGHAFDLSAQNTQLPASAFGLRNAAIALAVIGLGAGAAIGYTGALGTSPAHFWRAYLVAYLFGLTMCLGGLFFVLIQYLTRAGWSVAVRRPAEALASNLRWYWLLFIPFAILWFTGKGNLLWIWADLESLKAINEFDYTVVKKKVGFLNPTFFWIRAGIYFAAWAFLAWFFVGNSRAQDSTGDIRATERMQKWSGPAIILFGLTTTFASFDWIMSLSPVWFSTMFGVYFFCGCATAGFAGMILFTVRLQSMGVMKGLVSAEHFQDMGKLLFAFGMVFWAYIGFSQYMLIWYGNIPEETTWFMARQMGGWTTFSWLLIAGHFVVPFVFMISRWMKRWNVTLAVASAWMLFMSAVDLYWLIVPVIPAGLADASTYAELAEKHKDAPVGFFTLATLCSIGGMLCLFAWRTARTLSRNHLVPVRDPRLGESIAFQNI
jgi:hypothetical protein